MLTYHTARVIEHKDANYIEVTFLESTRFYRMFKDNKNYSANLALLKEAEKNSAPLLVKFTEQHGDIIEKVERVPQPKKE